VVSQELPCSRFERSGELRLPDFEQTADVFPVPLVRAAAFPLVRTVALPVIIASCLIVTRRSGGRGGQVGAGRRGKNGPAVGQQRPAVVEDHHAIAQKAPSLLWMAGHGPCTAAIMRKGTGAWGPMRALLFPRPQGGPKGLDGCHVMPTPDGQAGGPRRQG